jgi:hypothetical protein
LNWESEISSILLEPTTSGEADPFSSWNWAGTPTSQVGESVPVSLTALSPLQEPSHQSPMKLPPSLNGTVETLTEEVQKLKVE